MSDRERHKGDDPKHPELQTDLEDDEKEGAREISARPTEQENGGGRRFEPFPGDERQERERNRMNPSLDDLE
jgi:hypothetical protein